MELKGKTAIVTGGVSGLGEAAVRRYNDNGANIAIFDMNAERGKKIAQELGDNVIFFDVNVTDEDSNSH